MADVPETTVTPEAGEPPLSHEEGRKLLLSMIGTWTGQFDQYGGAEAYVHWLRYGSSSQEEEAP